jgi:ABC-2 type transport system permease protein
MNITDLLYRQRTVYFLKEIRPYLHYALQSATVAAVAAFLIFSIGYRQFLQWVTPDFPWELLAAAVMLPALAGGNIRTYLQEADTLFLLPQELAMDGYLKSAFRQALIRQIASVTAVWLIVWPVYYKLAPSNSWMFFLLLIVWALYKWAMLHGKWMELQLQEKRARFVFATTRWVLSAAAAYCFFLFNPGAGIFILGICSVLYLAALRVPGKFIVNWNSLIEAERDQKAGIYRKLNWFVDVPAVQGKARNMHGLDWIPQQINFRRERAYSFLYIIIWLRSELLGIILRLTLVGVLLLISISADYVQAIVYAVLAGFCAVQLADLKRYYHEHLWQHIYPLTEQQRKHSLLEVRLLIHYGVLIVLAVPLFVTFSNPLWAAALLLISAAASWLYHRFK